MAQYKVGSVNVVHNSQTVVGSSECEWLTYVSAGDLFKIVGQSVFYEIASVDSDTQLTLAALYAGDTASDQSYVIVSDFTPNYNLPEISKGDLDWVDIYNRAIRTIDSEIRTATTDRDMAGHTISNAYIDGSTFTSPTIDGATLTNPTIEGGTFTSPTIDGATLTNPAIDGATLTDSFMSGAIYTFVDGDTTPSVAGGNLFRTANTALTTISNFDDGSVGQKITVVFGDPNTILEFADGETYLFSQGDTFSAMCDGITWYEI